MEALMPELAKMGFGAVMFVMWWYERQDRLKADSLRDAAVRTAESATAQLTQLVTLTRDGAALMATLIAEVRALGQHRHGHEAA